MLLERAFSNVMSNCIRYAGTQVAVAVREKEGDILITVTDDGPGFPEGGTEHLFDRFYKGKGGNHGLGLAIAKVFPGVHGRQRACGRHTEGRRI